MKKRNVSLPLIVFSLCATTVCGVCKSQLRQNSTYSLTENNPLNRSPDDSIPSDSVQYSIWMKGQSSLVKVNGKVMKTTPDSTCRKQKNSIRVCGEGNTVLINRTDKKSKVNVRQKGENNHVNISQKGK